MKRIALLTILLASVVFLVPTYAEKPATGPEQVEVVNGPENSVPIQGAVEVTNTDENAVPVTVTNPSTGDATIKGIARQDGVVNTPTVGTPYDLISLTGSGTFIAARVLGIGGAAPSRFTLKLEIDGNLIVDEFV